METLEDLRNKNELKSVIGRNLNLLKRTHPVCFDSSVFPLEEFIPSIEMNYLQEKLGHYEKDRRRNKGETIPFLVNQSVKLYLLNAVNPKRRHLHLDNTFYLYSKNYEDVKRYTKPYYGFYPKDLFKFLESEEILKTHPLESQIYKTTKAFSLTDKTWNGLNDYLSNYQIDPKKKIIPNLDEKGISNLDSSGNPRSSTFQLPRWIDIKKINPHYSTIQSITENDFPSLGEFDEGDWYLLKMITGTLETFDGYLRQDYVESPFGRLYGRRINECLQLIPNRLLPFIIPGSFDYDIQASCYSLISQIAKKHNPRLKIDTIEFYVKNRKEIRRKIAKEVGVNEDLIKKCFTIIGHGGRQTKHSWFEKGKERSGSIHRILGDKYTEIFFGNQFVKKLCDEIKECGRTIVSKEIYPSFIPKSLPKRLAFTYQKTETKVLQKIVEFLQENEIEILSIKHDGLITSHKIDKGKVEEFIFQSTGFNISLEVERVGSIY